MADVTTENSQTSPTTVPSSPTQSEMCPVQTEVVCPSLSTPIAVASSLTAIVTALLATAIFVLVQIAVCKYHPKFTPEGAEIGTSAGGEGQLYGQAASDPTYTYVDIGEQGGGESTFELKDNEAYATYVQNN